MLSPDENELLCRVEGDAPMGQLMRRHWIPACMLEEVAEPDGKPVRVRLLGEDLVAFRDSRGRLGVLDEHCPHRRASLALGRNEDCGLRCLYHGWKIDVEGNVVDRPTEPRDMASVKAVRHPSYPCREAGGFVWVWMGAAEEARDFEPPAWAPSPGIRTSIVKIQVDCNWAQVLEGAIDSAHSSSLHSSDMVPAQVDGAGATEREWLRPSTDKAPKLRVQRTDYGFRYVAVRRPIKDADTHDYLRITLFVAPFTVLIPPNDRYNLSILNIPCDDVSTMFYFIAWSEKEGIDQEAWRKFCGAEVGVDLDANFRRIRTRDNNYLQDREAMKRGSHTGIHGIPNQDIAMWETMGRIADRSRERLGASDIAIVQFRRIMVDAARRVRDGGEATGTEANRIPLVKLKSFEGIVSKTTDWSTLGVPDEELVLRAKAPAQL
ncbi:MAG TPA: Rieske 2Fe-2S domain-containing protein [Casimicrobiaceae bacterium]|nr:Rieske 2Fe-2S domain-containing protein [Casimicrobiaceae bacterium]